MTNPSGQINTEGLPSRIEPKSYHGIAIKVVRDVAGTPVAAFDCNGRVVYLASDLTLDTLDSRAFPLTDDAVLVLVR